MTGRKVFQSTPPVKAATVESSLLPLCAVISIHAAREGGDGGAKNRWSPAPDFNPRRP